ncbi:hypothetical protein LPJ56_001969 [Coemansia sp. RSA 2599]|nr:hypothetical protein LPJ75_001595 [Coemansia sp. RSA 2598]KAJ1826861.1 hypothetical protein LPJ56_001969 [Coemansia sp. RSA 2599]
MANITIKVYYDQHQWDFVTVDRSIKVFDLFLHLFLENPNFYDVFILGALNNGEFQSFNPDLSLEECNLADDSLVYTARIKSEPLDLDAVDALLLENILNSKLYCS